MKNAVNGKALPRMTDVRAFRLGYVFAALFISNISLFLRQCKVP